MAKEHGMIEHKGTQYPHQSQSSGLAREGGGTGTPLATKHASGALNSFWDGFMKVAAFKMKFSPATVKHAPAPLTGMLPRVPFAGPAERKLNYKDIFSAERAKKMRPQTTTDYGKAKAQWEAAKPQGGTLSYGPKGQVTSTAPGAPTAESKAMAQQKAQVHSQKIIANATKGHYTQPQYDRVGVAKQPTVKP